MDMNTKIIIVNILTILAIMDHQLLISLMLFFVQNAPAIKIDKKIMQRNGNKYGKYFFFIIKITPIYFSLNIIIP